MNRLINPPTLPEEGVCPVLDINVISTKTVALPPRWPAFRKNYQIRDLWFQPNADNEGQRSQRPGKQGDPTRSQAYCLQTVSRSRRKEDEFRKSCQGPEVGGPGVGSGEAKTAGVRREEYQEAESCAEIGLQKFAEGPSCVIEQQQYTNARKQIKAGVEPLKRFQGNNAQRFHGTRYKAFSHQLE